MLPVARTPDMVCHADLASETLHGVDGLPMLRRHAEDAARLRRGLPVPVRCCWNGAVAMDAAPFLDGVRIR